MADTSNPVTITEVLRDDYLADLGSRSLAELRSMRESCLLLETELSYVRRLLQGRMDIVSDELVRRRRGETSTPADLVARLPGILADGPSNQPRGNRLVRMLRPAEETRIEASVEGLLGFPLGAIAESTEADVDSALGRLREGEREVSGQRRGVHNRLDAINAEVARRYGAGEASVDELLGER